MEGFGLGSQFLPGFRFHPTDQELIIHYLRKKVTSSLTAATSIIANIDLYKFNPWDLPGKAFFGEGEWFFFSPRDRKDPNGTRPNRAAGSGYWKATGIDKPIIAAGGFQCLGVKKALVFYKGRPPKGIKTDWGMHEYRLLDDKPSSRFQNHRGSMRLDDWVLCRVRQKGCIPADTTSEIHEISGFSNPCIIPKSQENRNLRERSKSINEWSDDQLLAYLLDSQGEGGESTPEDSDSPKFFSQDKDNMGDCRYVADFAQPSQLVPSMLDSIKRTPSFGTLDELMLQPANKRLHYTYCEPPSPTSSFSVDRVSPEFVI